MFRQILRPLRNDTASRLDSVVNEPARILAAAGLTPDPWQATVLNATSPRTLLLCCRQAGKSTCAAALALRDALLSPPALVLLLSPTLRQSGELFRDKLLPLWTALGRPAYARPPTRLELELSNGSRIISLPENEAGIRGFSGVRLLLIDEASRVDDGLYRAVRPMLAVSGGALVALSTPFGKRGWFFDAWESQEPWQRVRITAEQCPRITPAFLAEEQRALGDRWYRQEYGCSFEDAVDAVFSPDAIRRAVSPGVQPLFGGSL